MVGLGIEPANPGLQDEWFNRVQLSSSFWQNKSILSIPVVLGGGGGMFRSYTLYWLAPGESVQEPS